MSSLIILPTQLYEIGLIEKTVEKNKIGKIIFYNDPQYYTAYNYNKKRLLLHRASSLIYFEKLKSGFNKTGIILKWEEKTGSEVLAKYQPIFVFDPIDKPVRDIFIKKKATILESPNFINDFRFMEMYYKKITDKKQPKRIIFNAFYENSKHNAGLEIGKSQDTLNRNRIPAAEIKAASKPVLSGYKRNPETLKIIADSIKWVASNFPKNPGTLPKNPADFRFPVSSEEAGLVFRRFIANLGNFGTYQDALGLISGNNPTEEPETFYHSGLSSSINIGLLNPEKIINYFKKNIINKPEVVKKIGINNIEGYIRQLFWREYQRFIYIYFEDRISPLVNSKNYTFPVLIGKKDFNKSWYSSDSELPDPVKKCINLAFDTGYLHHIQRLMVVGNFMLISGVDPVDAFRWFMEFSIDSYEWVMCQNVFDMVFCCSGGLTMTKVYYSSSNYLLKMATPGSAKSDWPKVWDSVYDKFTKKNYNILKHFRR